MSERRRQFAGPVGAALLAWVVPGLGHLVLGRKAKALLFFVLIVGTFVAGWLMSGCENVYFERGRWHALVQIGAGLPAFVIGLGRSSPEPQLTVMSGFEIATLYTMVAGLLNVLVIMDAVLTSLRLRKGTT